MKNKSKFICISGFKCTVRARTRYRLYHGVYMMSQIAFPVTIMVKCSAHMRLHSLIHSIYSHMRGVRYCIHNESYKRKRN